MTAPTPAQIWSRKEWSEPFTRCWVCGYDFTRPTFPPNEPRWREIHEIERRGQTTNWAYRCNYFITCNVCHATTLAASNQQSHAMQLALKWIFDREHYDLKLWHSLKPRPETYVTFYEVRKWVVKHRADDTRLVSIECLFGEGWG